jgi:HSP20 family protein
VQVSAPGVKPEDIQVTMDRGILRIKGETKCTRDGWETMRRIEKSVQLPEQSIDESGVEACSEHGMLCICVPKKPKSQAAPPRSIQVKWGKSDEQDKSDEQSKPAEFK